jgi:DNA-binding NtrC family response regulator
MTPLHLLVLEHDPERREALLRLVRGQGHHAAAAPDAVAVAAAIGVPGFDALLLDLGWPDLDLARLREALVPSEPAAPDSLEAAERRHIALALRHTAGNKRQAAHLLGISRSTLLHKVRKYGLATALLLAVAPAGDRLAGAHGMGHALSARPLIEGAVVPPNEPRGRAVTE